MAGSLKNTMESTTEKVEIGEREKPANYWTGNIREEGSRPQQITLKKWRAGKNWKLLNRKYAWGRLENTAYNIREEMEIEEGENTV